MTKTFVWIAVAGLTLTGCGSTTLTRTGPTFPAKPLGCDFQIFTTPPASSFTEIGVLDVNPGGYGSNTYREVSDFKTEIAPYVCQAGGDAAIAYANGYGMYIKATILKTLAAPADAPVTAATSGASAPPATGCTYDTQCKGERICVKGECAEPATAASVPAPGAP